MHYINKLNLKKIKIYLFVYTDRQTEKNNGVENNLIYAQ